MPEIDGFESLVTKLNQAKKLSTEIEKSWEKINKSSKGFSGALGAAKGGTGVGGTGTRLPGATDMGSGLAGNSGSKNVGAGDRFESDITSENKTPSNMLGLGDVVSYMGSLGSAVNKFMPGVKDTLNRATSYYNAGVYGGNQMGRASLQATTFGTLSKMSGLTSKGSDANVAQFLGGRGMTASADEGSTYQQTLRTVANAARYMNISNEDAARSVEGLTSAKGSAEMLRNFGIYTADLDTGKEKTQGEIFKELADRLTAGRGQANVEQTQASIRRGALGVTIDSFFQGDAQGGQMFKQYMIERAKGNTMDLSQSNDVARKIGSSENINPLNSQMAMATSDTAVMQSAEKGYIAGINTATQSLQALNVVAMGLSQTFGSVSALIQTLFGHGTVQGLTQGVTSTVNFAGKAVSSLMELGVGLGPAAAAAGIATVGVIGASGALALGGSAIANVSGNPSSPNNGGNGVGGGGDGGTMPASSAAAPATRSRSDRLFDMSLLYSGHSVTEKLGSVNPIRGGRPHGGTDLNYTNDPVYALADGKVINVRKTYNRNDSSGGSIGNFVNVLHTSKSGKQYTTIYGHLKSVAVNVGDYVTRGQKLGISGNTGHSTGAHLHFEIREGRVMMAGTGKSVTLEAAQNISGSTALSQGSTTTPGASAGPDAATQSAVSALTNAQAGYNAQAKKGMSILSGLYSGNQTAILGAVGTMAANMGAGSIYSNMMATGDPNVYQQPNGSGVNGTGTGGNTNNNNVSIIVQVPDVTSADAVKFAQLVKQYLDSDSLLSNTGSI